MRIDQADFNWPWIYRTPLSNQLARDLSPGNQTYNKALAVACNDLGDKSFANGEYREPAGAYQRALALFKYNRTYQWNTIQAWVGYGDQCLARYDYDEAIQAYRQAF